MEMLGWYFFAGFIGNLCGKLLHYLVITFCLTQKKLPLPVVTKNTWAVTQTTNPLTDEVRLTFVTKLKGEERLEIYFSNKEFIYASVPPNYHGPKTRVIRYNEEKAIELKIAGENKKFLNQEVYCYDVIDLKLEDLLTHNKLLIAQSFNDLQPAEVNLDDFQELYAKHK